VQLLLEAGAKVDETDKYGQTALMLAAGRGNMHIVKLLLAANADTKLVSKSRATAYDFAFENMRKEVAQLLKNK